MALRSSSGAGDGGPLAALQRWASRAGARTLLLLLAAAAPLVAQTPEGLDARRRELAQLQQRLVDLRARYSASRRLEADLKQALATAELNLQIQTAERRVLELNYADVERATTKAAADRDEAARLATALRDDLGRRVVALYRMGRLGYLRTLVVAESGRTFLRGLQVLTHLAKKDAALLERYREAERALEGREEELQDRRAELADLAAKSRAKEAELAAARADKARLLARASRTAAQEKAQVAALEDKSRRLAALLTLLENSGRPLPPGAASIRRYRGVLDWPLAGSVVVPFGRIANPKFPKTFLRSSGWTLEAQPGTPVRAVFAGEVAYSRWLKGYGNLVVLDHGDGVFSLYGRLATGSAVPRGQHLKLGDPVGLLGPSPDEEVPGLYFEIRDDRVSVDPKLWLK